MESLPAPVDRATQLYRAADYHGVQAIAQNVVQASPDDPSIYLLLGSAQLLIGQTDDAALSLRLVRDIGDPVLAAEARWQLAQAYLLTGDPKPAFDELTFLAKGTSSRAADAAAQLAQLEAAEVETER